MDSRAAQDQARRYLSAFQVSLLSWIRNAPDAKIAETRIGKISEQMAQHATRAESHQLWRTASVRSEEHTSELQSLMRISYAVICLKKKQKRQLKVHNTTVLNNITLTTSILCLTQLLPLDKQ